MVRYQLGDETSERQWGDIMGLIKVRRHDLDDNYLDRWATQPKVENLLSRARRGAGNEQKD